MIDEKVARLRAHDNNINRYRRLLGTNLSDLERQFIERRLKEEVCHSDCEQFNGRSAAFSGRKLSGRRITIGQRVQKSSTT